MSLSVGVSYDEQAKDKFMVPHKGKWNMNGKKWMAFIAFVQIPKQKN